MFVFWRRCRAVRRGPEPVHLQADEEERGDQLGEGRRQLVRRGRPLQQEMGQALQVSQSILVIYHSVIGYCLWFTGIG